MTFAPTLESLRSHGVPDWYEDAKLGIFIHWGLFSIPAFAPRFGVIHEVLARDYDNFVVHTPYTEWYENAIKFPDSPSARYHKSHYGERSYDSFRDEFTAGLEHWDPVAWATLFRDAGARYVVLVSKHHDGYCLWPSRVPNPHRKDWHAQRDLVGELAAAVRAVGLRFGVYYSGGIDWSFNPTPIRNPGEFLASIPEGEDYRHYADAQCRELIERVAPDVLWNDIAWPSDDATLFRLFADYYNAVPEGVINDRWTTPNIGTHILRNPLGRFVLNAIGKQLVKRVNLLQQPAAPPHWDYRTPEYTSFAEIQERKWECVRGLGNSFAYNRMEPPESILGLSELVHSFVDLVAKNGNLLLNVGPRGEDAQIPHHQAARLRELGAWLARCGEAVHGTRPWTRAEGRSAEGLELRFTSRQSDTGTILYAHVLGTPEPGRLTLPDIRARSGAAIERLGAGPLLWRQVGGSVVIETGPAWEPAPAHALRIPL